jgi:hypothetical protein
MKILTTEDGRERAKTVRRHPAVLFNEFREEV